MSRIIYCECGNFISIDVQDLQKYLPKKCITCCMRDAIALFKRMDAAEFNLSVTADVMPSRPDSKGVE